MELLNAPWLFALVLGAVFASTAAVFGWRDKQAVSKLWPLFGFGVGSVVFGGFIALLVEKPVLEALLLQGKFGQLGGPRDGVDWGISFVVGYALIFGAACGLAARLTALVASTTRSARTDE